MSKLDEAIKLLLDYVPKYPIIVYLPRWFFNAYNEEIPKDTKYFRYVPLPEKFEVKQSCSMEIKTNFNKENGGK